MMTFFALRARPKWGVLGLAAAAIIAVTSGALAKLDTPKKGGESIAIAAHPFDFEVGHGDRKKFGKLIWRGGLVLRSTSKYFGGLSGIAMDSAGRRMIAVTDTGAWITAKVSYDGEKLKALSNVRVGPILSRKGKKLKKKRLVDAESIDLLPQMQWRKGNKKGNKNSAPARRVLISFERLHRIGVFPLTSQGIGAPSHYLKLPKGAKKSKRNKSLESVAYLSVGRLSGRVLTFAERNLDENGNLRGWLLANKRPGAKSFALALKRRKGFDITDVAELPNGDILLLERRFRVLEGVKMRLRRIRQAALKPGALLDGETLLEATQAYQIDNMEGLAVHRSEKGETVITLVSDNNFHFLQRTLLMQFTLPPSKKPAPRKRKGQTK